MSFETLLSHSRVWIFGRPLKDVSIINNYNAIVPNKPEDANDYDTPAFLGNNFLLSQLTKPGALLARIYSFSFEARFFELDTPAIYLVHGEGMDPEGVSGKLTADQRKLSRMPGELGRTGLASVSGSFTGDIRAWAYDKEDFTIRMDMSVGTFESTLLSSELGDPDSSIRSSGSVARSSGSVARASGSVARAAGSVARARRGSGE